MRRPAQAERAFRRALELNPNFALACAYLGNALADLGAHNEAIENANRALRLSPNDRLVELRVFIVRTNVYFAAKRYGDATAEAGKMIERFPEIPGGHFLLVATAALQEDMQTAAAALSVAARVAPGLTVAKLRDDAPFVGDAMDRFLEGLRKAGVSET
jgi:tetratricopeptide (TPR) repeat protein